jgi:hypothetical protein
LQLCSDANILMVCSGGSWIEVDCGTSNCKPQGLVRGTSVDAWDLVARSAVLDVFAGYNRLERIEIYM